VTQPLAWLRGQFLPQSGAALPLNDAGFVWGATVTDLCRTFRQRLFRLSDHVRRFRESCRLARVPLRASDEELTGIAGQLVTHNAALVGDGELALVLLATPGPVGYYLGQPGGPGEGEPTLALHTFPLPLARHARLFREGASLVIPATRSMPADAIDPRIKQRSRLHWWIAEQEAHDLDPPASALLVDAGDRVTETAAANLLIVKDGRVLTPSRSRVLNGVSLQVVEELCGEEGIPFSEADLTPADCANADEALLANTAYCLAPVRRIQGGELPCPGPVFERLLAAWSAKVGLDVRGQILGAAGAQKMADGTADEVTIRPFAGEDALAVARLWREVFPNDPPRNVPEEIIRRKLGVQRELFLVAGCQGQVAGTVLAGYDGHRGWLHLVAVAPRFRLRGIGRTLIAEAERRLALAGCPKVNLQVRATNGAVVDFYRKLGYAVEDLVNMGKPLAP
jgi:branched-subunit amino acid aminotransferase/4-amino-4-deoxychorismate lyase/ribosomal protein S18 acetylase RimI-like enzyme